MATETIAETTPENPPAFPALEGKTDLYGRPVGEGMTLRDWFAGQALMAVIRQCSGDRIGDASSREAYFAETAYDIADAMLRERAK